jgi:hypothetical protein
MKENLISGSKFLSEKLIVCHLAKEFSAFYRTSRFVTLFTRTCHCISIWSNINLVHALIPYLFKIYFNIILSSALKSPSDLFPHGFPTKTLYVCLIFSTLRPAYPPYVNILLVPDAD